MRRAMNAFWIVEARFGAPIKGDSAPNGYPRPVSHIKVSQPSRNSKSVNSADGNALFDDKTIYIS